jgi:tetratricopeptide (TPR) repeat protein
VVTIAERGVECGAEGATLGMLRLAQAQAQRWRGENESARRHGLEAMALLEEGSRPFCEACGEVATAAGRISDHACLADVVEKLVRLEPTSDAVGAQAIASARACVQLIHAGETDTARALLFRAEQRADRAGSRDPSVRAHLEVVRRSMAERTDLGRAYAHAEAAVAEFDRAGDRRSMCMQRINLGFTAVLVGRYEEAERTLREAVVTAEQMGLGDAGAIARQNLGLALMLRGSLSEAQRLEEETAAALARQNNRLMEGGSRVYLARILLACGAPAEARRQAELACALSAALPAASAYAHAALGAALLALGETEPALAEAREAMDLSRSLGTMHEGDVFVQTVLADALAATGRGDESRVVIERARELIVARAEGIEDEAVRRSFLRAVENAALLDRWRAGE